MSTKTRSERECVCEYLEDYEREKSASGLEVVEMQSSDEASPKWLRRVWKEKKRRERESIFAYSYFVGIIIVQLDSDGALGEEFRFTP